jgi:hypothetical protein
VPPGAEGAPAVRLTEVTALAEGDLEALAEALGGLLVAVRHEAEAEAAEAREAEREAAEAEEEERWRAETAEAQWGAW